MILHRLLPLLPLLLHLDQEVGEMNQLYLVGGPPLNLAPKKNKKKLFDGKNRVMIPQPLPLHPLHLERDKERVLTLPLL